MSGTQCPELSSSPPDQGDEFELWPFPSAVGCARGHATAVLREWGLDDLVRDAELIISELITNAVNAAISMINTKPVLLRLFLIRGWLIIEAWDSSPAVPELQKPDDDEPSGRGLMIVEALSDDCGYDVTVDGRKAVWAKINLARA